MEVRVDARIYIEAPDVLWKEPTFQMGIAFEVKDLANVPRLCTLKMGAVVIEDSQ